MSEENKMMPINQRFINDKTGRVYNLLYISNTNAIKPEWIETAVYQDSSGNVWSRPLCEFAKRMTMVEQKEGE